MLENRFDLLFEYILKVEGGYSDDEYDKGGKTKYGIIEEEARRHGYKGHMRDLTKDFAKNIYKTDYYDKCKLEKVNNDKIALSIFDWAVNSGNARAIKKAQLILNELGYKLEVDGVIGNKTISALNTVNVSKFLNKYHEAQRRYYKIIVYNNPKQKVFLKGWMNRVDTKECFIKNKL